jgi:cytidyltransferase-like protein
MNNITIIPGSYKPPHKGHLSLIEKLIKKNNNKKIIIIISKKSRPLDEVFKMENKSKEQLQEALIKSFPKEKDEILALTKGNLEKKIKTLIETNKLKSVNYQQSLKVWNIYLKYLKNKYTMNLSKRSVDKELFSGMSTKENTKLPIIQLKVSETNNIIQETTKTMLKCFREDKPKKIILMKSEKNRNNKRFDFLTSRFGKYIDTVLFPNIKDIDATNMRKDILNNNKKDFMNYLPKDLDEKDKLKIWNICTKMEI